MLVGLIFYLSTLTEFKEGRYMFVFPLMHKVRCDGICEAQCTHSRRQLVKNQPHTHSMD